MYGIAPMVTPEGKAISDPRGDLIAATDRSIEAIVPHLTPEKPCFSLVIPLIWKPVEPYAVGAAIGEDVYAEARVAVSAAVTKEHDKPIASVCLMRQGYNRGSPGGIYIHNLVSGSRQRLYVYDSDMQIQAIAPSPYARPQRARKQRQ